MMHQQTHTYGTYHVHTYGTRANVNAALDTLSYTSDATDNVAYLDCRASQKFDDIEYFAETNHFYQQFDSVSYLRWDQTLRDSCTTRYRGLQGYLMDYTSSAEREWVEDIFDSDGTVWMGGSDDDITHTHTCSDDQTGTTEDNISVTISEGDGHGLMVQIKVLSFGMEEQVVLHKTVCITHGVRLNRQIRFFTALANGCIK